MTRNRKDGPTTAPRVWIHGEEPLTFALATAVTEGGGIVAATASQAEAIVWAADDPPGLRRALHPGIRWVQLSSAGVEDWFEEGIIDSERLWTAAKGVYSGPMAEYVVAAVLLFARRFPEALVLRRWHRLEPRCLAGSTVGIVGAGLTGEAILRLLSPFGIRSLALTRSGRVVAGADRSFGPDALDEVLGASDYVILAAPETAETRGLLGAGRLATVKRGAVLVNVGRGSIVDTDALVEALRDRRIAGAALDVTDPEPLPAWHPLWELPNVLVSSHTACTPELGASAFAARVRENVDLYRRSQPLLGMVDLHVGY